MVWGISGVEPGGMITLERPLEVHRRLLAGTRLEEHGSRIRGKQNWIGGSHYTPCSAEFVLPPETVVDLLGDLFTFCNNGSLPEWAQAAIAHAQFETIHPFVDGNGRTGRVLLHLITRRRGLGLRLLSPVSLALATWSRDYVVSLTATHYVDPSDSDEAHIGAFICP